MAGEPTQASLRDQVNTWLKGREEAWIQFTLEELNGGERLSEEGAKRVVDRLLYEGVTSKTKMPQQAVAPADIDLPQNGRLTIKRVHNLHNVMGIADGQELTFAPSGLTIVFGYNGSGKTGYSKVLQAASRTPLNPNVKVLPNVYTDSDVQPSASIEICYVEENGAEIPGSTRCVPWSNGVYDEELQKIRFYDSAIATAILGTDAENKHPFTAEPNELGVFRKLVESAPLLTSELKSRLGEVETAKNAIAKNEGESTYWSELAVLSIQDIEDRLANSNPLTDEEELQLIAAASALSGTAAEKLRIQRGELARLSSISERFDQCLLAVSEASVAMAKERIQELVVAREASQALAASHDQNLEFSISGNAWKALWEAANEFAGNVYAGHVYPSEVPDAKCVLCQQSLDAAAKDRFTTFREFVSSSIQADLDSARAACDALITRLPSISTALTELEKADVLQAGDQSLVDACNALAAAINGVVVALRGALVTANTELLPVAMPPETENPLTTPLAELSAEVEARARASDAATIKVQQALHDSLLKRKWYVENRERIDTYRMEREEEKMLRTSAESIDTTLVSNARRGFLEGSVGAVVTNRVDEELKNLGAEKLKFKYKVGALASGTVAKKQLQSTKPAPIREVFSEGERKVASLACFLAEASTDNGPLVFDDPVTSLDMIYRRHISRRLTESSQERQALVFTHDALFVLQLRRQCAEIDVPLNEVYLVVHDGSAGTVSEESPFVERGVPERLALIEAEYHKMKLQIGTSQYRDYHIRAVKESRSTLERLIVSELFQGVVNRFDHEVHSLGLLRVSLPNDFVKRITELMSRLSEELHDSAEGDVLPEPKPESIVNAVVEMRAIIKDIRDQANILEKERAQYKPKLVKK